MFKIYKEPCWSALRATLFGKFYESIVAGYFKYVCGFEVCDRGISISVDDLENPNDIERRIQQLKGQNVDHAMKLVRKYEEEWNKLRKKRFNPDLVLKKDDKYYIVEMQVWPVWLERKYNVPEFSWEIILNEGVAIIPRAFASRVKVCGASHAFQNVAGFYYVTYSRGSDHEDIESVLRVLTQREFRLIYVKEIVENVARQYDHENYRWFREIIAKVKENVEDFLNGLEQGEIRLKDASRIC